MGKGGGSLFQYRKEVKRKLDFKGFKDFFLFNWFSVFRLYAELFKQPRIIVHRDPTVKETDAQDRARPEMPILLPFMQRKY